MRHYNSPLIMHCIENLKQYLWLFLLFACSCRQEETASELQAQLPPVSNEKEALDRVKGNLELYIEQEEDRHRHIDLYNSDNRLMGYEIDSGLIKH